MASDEQASVEGAASAGDDCGGSSGLPVVVKLCPLKLTQQQQSKRIRSEANYLNRLQEGEGGEFHVARLLGVGTVSSSSSSSSSVTAKSASAIEIMGIDRAAGSTSQDGVYLMMEHLGSTTLTAFVNSTAFNSVANRTAIVKKLIESVEYLHGKGAYHGDLRPSKVMIVPQSEAMLVGKLFRVKSKPLVKRPEDLAIDVGDLVELLALTIDEGN